MSSLHDTFSDFFGKSVDGATGDCECLYCERSSSEGRGRWSEGRHTWVCDEHIATQDADDEAKRQEKRERAIKQFGSAGRGYLVSETEIKPGDSFEDDGETYIVESADYSPGGENPNTEDFDPAGWYVKIR
jgi:hypothetical protein